MDVFLFSILLAIPATLIDVFAFGFVAEENGPTNLLLNLILFIPSLSVGVRRLHDTGRSGWWLLLIFAILIGWIALFIFFVSDGDSGENQYGLDPKLEQDIGEIFS